MVNLNDSMTFGTTASQLSEMISKSFGP